MTLIIEFWRVENCAFFQAPTASNCVLPGSQSFRRTGPDVTENIAKIQQMQ